MEKEYKIELDILKKVAGEPCLSMESLTSTNSSADEVSAVQKIVTSGTRKASEHGSSPTPSRPPDETYATQPGSAYVPYISPAATLTYEQLDKLTPKARQALFEMYDWEQNHAAMSLHFYPKLTPQKVFPDYRDSYAYHKEKYMKVDTGTLTESPPLMPKAMLAPSMKQSAWH